MPRIPLAISVESRTNSTAKDSRIVNAFIETKEGRKYIVKRPGVASFTVTPALAAGTAQGMYYFHGTGNVYPVVGNTIYQVTPAGASTSKGTVTAGLYSFLETSQVPYLFFHNSTNGYTINGTTGVFAAVTSVNFPPNQTPARPLVPGVVYLDDTVYVMETTGRIYNSALEDPTTWGALDFISKSSEPDGAVALAKHLSYVVAFGHWSGEFFYNAGNPTGSPLARNDTAKIEIGCANANSVVQILSNQTVVWAGQSREFGRGVYILTGLAPQKISTESIDYYLNADAMINVRAWAVQVAGRSLYVLTLKDSGFTFVYDLHEKEWYQWTSDNGAGVESFFSGEFFSALSGVNFIQNTDGTLSKLSQATYQDLGRNINYRVVTHKFDNNNNKNKFWFSVELIGDTVTGLGSIRHTNDDYTTWSSYRTVDLSKQRPIIYQLGYGKRKAFDIWITLNQPIRLEGLEATVEEGLV